LVLIGDVYSDHAAISLAADRRDLARTSLAKALELYEAKGDVPDTERTRVRLQRLTDH
jgi:hypothetical protein